MRFKIFKHGGYGGNGLTVNGGNLTGPLILSRNPVFDLEAATKNYLDSALTTLNAGNLSSGTLPVSALPAMTGDLINSEGSSNFLLTNTGISPNAYTKVTINSKGRATNGFALTEADLPGIYWDKVLYNRPVTVEAYGINDAVPASGGTLTGKLYLDNPPIDHLHAVNKSYIDTVASSNVNGINVGDIVKKVTSITPSGFFKCNGGEVSKTTYPALYSAVGDVGDKQSIDIQPDNGRPWVQQYQLNDKQNTIIGSAIDTGITLPNVVINSPVVVTKNKVFIFNCSYNNILSANINSDGTLGNLITIIGVFPYTINRESSSIVIKNKIYLFGGYYQSVYSNAVYSCIINADGTLGTWTIEKSIPYGISSTRAIVVKNRVYLIGGETDNYGVYSKVCYADINSDGSLSDWVQYNDLPFNTAYTQIAVIKNRIYVIGGNTSTNIYYCTINSDGSLSSWTLYGNIPRICYFGEAVVTKNRVYLVCVRDVYNQYNYGHSAPINADGTLGAWVDDCYLPSNLTNSCVIVTNSKLYLLGGSTSVSAINNIYSFNFTGGCNDYSAYYGGSGVTADQANFRLPDYSFKELPNTFSYIKY